MKLSHDEGMTILRYLYGICWCIENQNDLSKPSPAGAILISEAIKTVKKYQKAGIVGKFIVADDTLFEVVVWLSDLEKELWNKEAYFAIPVVWKHKNCRLFNCDDWIFYLYELDDVIKILQKYMPCTFLLYPLKTGIISGIYLGDIK